jgi:hypothetical protein
VSASHLSVALLDEITGRQHVRPELDVELDALLRRVLERLPLAIVTLEECAAVSKQLRQGTAVERGSGAIAEDEFFLLLTRISGATDAVCGPAADDPEAGSRRWLDDAITALRERIATATRGAAGLRSALFQLRNIAATRGLRETVRFLDGWEARLREAFKC